MQAGWSISPVFWGAGRVKQRWPEDLLLLPVPAAGAMLVDEVLPPA